MKNLTTQIAPIQGKAKALIPEIQKSVTNAKAALSNIKAVNSAEDAEKVNKLLAKVRTTYNKVKGYREEMTKPLDEFKKELMALENEIATTKKDNEYARVKNELDRYWNEIEAKKREEQKRIEAEKAHNIELERIKSEMLSAIDMGFINALETGETALIKVVDNATLESYDNSIKLLNYKPNLKPELFNKWLDVPHNNSVVSEIEFEQLKRETFDSHYGKTNEDYIDKSTVLLKQYKEKLEAKKPELERLAKADDAEREKIERHQKSVKAKEEADRQARIEAEKKAAEEAKRDREAESTMEHEFKAQVRSQELEEAEGVRRNVSYRLKGNPNAMQAAKALSNVIIHCVASEDFKGIYKLDKDGNPKQEDGQPVYIDGINDWLKQLAKVNKDATIEGIDKIEKVSSVVRK
jgi:hypothetical protein